MGQLRWLIRVVVFVAAGQVLLGLLQVAGGEHSPLFFGAVPANRPIGTFANSNHFANYLAVALVLYVWLAWDALAPHEDARPNARSPRSDDRRFAAFWIAGGLFLVMGILMARSRGAALSGLPAAVIAAGWLMARARGSRLGWRGIAAVMSLTLIGVVAAVGVEFLSSRFAISELASSASFRSTLTQSTLIGAREFWPWGAGWGVYGAVYPRFQPPEIPGSAGYAHQDYAQMLFEGGIFAFVLAGAFAWLVVRRAIQLGRVIRRHHRLRRETIAAAVCGLGLLGFLLHSLVEFNMHIPANAILACLLAGVFLRPLADAGEAP